MCELVISNEDNTKTFQERENTIFLFDVDGTLTESGNIIQNDMCELLNFVRECGFKTGVVGGGTLQKVLEQADNKDEPVYFDHYFTECGCQHNVNLSSTTGKQLHEIYHKNIREHWLYPSINKLMKVCMNFISEQDYLIAGNLVDLRKGIVYISMVGMTATSVERSQFILEDNANHYRKRLIQLLSDTAMKLGVYEDLSINEGGQVGIAIFPREWDKIQVLDYVLPYHETIHYFGDKYKTGGNDHRIINDSHVIGHRVDSPEDTYTILKQILATRFA